MNIAKKKLSGIEITFAGYSDDWFIPHSTIPLNGTHMFSLGVISKGDLKVHVWFNGCISACMFYNSPLFKYSQEWQLHPSSEVNEEIFLTMSTQVSDFLQMNQFVEDQKVKLDNKVLLINVSMMKSEIEKLTVLWQQQ